MTRHCFFAFPLDLPAHRGMWPAVQSDCAASNRKGRGQFPFRSFVTVCCSLFRSLSSPLALSALATSRSPRSSRVSAHPVRRCRGIVESFVFDAKGQLGTGDCGRAASTLESEWASADADTKGIATCKFGNYRQRPKPPDDDGFFKAAVPRCCSGGSSNSDCRCRNLTMLGQP